MVSTSHYQALHATFSLEIWMNPPHPHHAFLFFPPFSPLSASNKRSTRVFGSWKRMGKKTGRKMKDKQQHRDYGLVKRLRYLERGGRGSRWVLCCVFSVKQLVMSRKGSISEEMWSKDHLPTDWSLPWFFSFFLQRGGQLGLNHCTAWKEVRFLSFLACGSRRKHHA